MGPAVVAGESCARPLSVFEGEIDEFDETESDLGVMQAYERRAVWPMDALQSSVQKSLVGK